MALNCDLPNYGISFLCIYIYLKICIEEYSQMIAHTVLHYEIENNNEITFKWCSVLFSSFPGSERKEYITENLWFGKKKCWQQETRNVSSHHSPIVYV